MRTRWNSSLGKVGFLLSVTIEINRHRSSNGEREGRWNAYVESGSSAGISLITKLSKYSIPSAPFCNASFKPVT